MERHLHYSRAVAALKLALILLLGGWALWWAVWGLLSGHVVFMLTGVIAVFFVLFLLPVIPQTIRALHDRRPIVTLNVKGVEDVRNEPSFIAWEDVGQMRFGMRRYNRSRLLFFYRDPDMARAKPGSRPGVTRVVRAVTGKGEWSVDLGPLRCRNDEILELAQRLKKEAMRQRIVAASQGTDRGPGHGWSGRLS